MRIIVATRNYGKLAEIERMLDDMDLHISSLLDFPVISDVVEDGKTFLENAQKKARCASKASGLWTLADDSGLVVDALGGAPGVMSARFAGRQSDYEANNRKLLEEMKDVPDGKRSATFVCSMVLSAPDGREWHTEDRCEGVIAREPKGAGGFGYDPLFFIPEEAKTMAELTMARKNEISHRGRALAQIRKILIEIRSL